MKNFFLVVVFLIGTTNVTIAKLQSKIDECFELTSIVFRLADAPEYVNNDISAYSTEIDRYFAKYKKHRLISFAKEIREEYGIGYDAIANAAACVEIRDGKLVAKQDGAITINQMDVRWTETVFNTFVTLLSDFYQKTKFQKFHARHAALHNIATERMNALLEELDPDWFQSVLGINIETSRVIVSLSNGPHNYAFFMPGENGSSL